MNVNLTPNARTVFEKRYSQRDKNGKPLETAENTMMRVATVVAARGDRYNLLAQDFLERRDEFYSMLCRLDFLPNSPTFTGAGTSLGQLAACFVLPISDDMGRNNDGLFSTLRDAVLIQQTGGGNGFSFGKIRPRGSSVGRSNGVATGPVGFIKAYDACFGVVAQGGVRRGANMAVLPVHHPDIEEFIECKATEGNITNFNVSVALTDDFMHAATSVGTNDFDLINPHDGTVAKTINAKDLLRKIATYAHRNGEPGCLFIDRANEDNPVPKLYKLEATNPCAEQWLGPYENCCLGSVNLANFVDGKDVAWDRLLATVRTATRFLDSVVDANKYVDGVPELEKQAKAIRRIGLGIMGLADMFIELGIEYGSDESVILASKLMEFIRYSAMVESVALAKEFGAFPEIENSIYAPHECKDLLNRMGKTGTLEWGMMADLVEAHGLRNGALTTVAPTGTISTVAGVEGYGCEPIFALGYIRNFNDNGTNKELRYLSPLFEKMISEAKENGEISELDADRALDMAANIGTIQDATWLPERLRKIFVTSGDITPIRHLRMQAALQQWIDNSISKTINAPAGTTVDDVLYIYSTAHGMGLKGVTVYVEGSREKVVLETKVTKDAKEAKPDALVPTPGVKEPRPRIVHGTTTKSETPLGPAYVTLNRDGSGNPFEVFVNVGRSGTETQANAEAIGRLASLALRIDTTDKDLRLANVIEQLSGIGGGSSVGFGINRVSSLPDGIAKALELSWIPGESGEAASDKLVPTRKAMGICPSCGQATMLRSEGCEKCVECGYAKC